MDNDYSASLCFEWKIPKLEASTIIQKMF